MEKESELGESEGGEEGELKVIKMQYVYVPVPEDECKAPCISNIATILKLEVENK